MRPTHLFLFVILSAVALKSTQATRSRAVALKSTQATRYPVEYEIFDNTSGTPDTRFKSQVGLDYGLQALVAATDFVLNTFEQSKGGGREYVSVSVVVESFVANGRPFAIVTTNGSQIDVNADYLQTFPGNVKYEFTGILYFASGLVWEWTGNGNAPKGLITGIADYMRLISGTAYRGWPRQGLGSRWDEGYAFTANFLEYCDLLRPGFVSDLNAMMIDAYSDAYFVELLGKSVDELWHDYKTIYATPGLAPAQTFGH